MLHADRVVLYRVLDWNHILPGEHTRSDSRTIEGNEVIDSTEVPLKSARQLIPILANPSTWNAALRKGEPELVAVARFSSKGAFTDVSFSFEDDAISVRHTIEDPDGSIRASESWIGRSEKERVRIIWWLQAAFPDEERIQNLRETFRGFDYVPPRIRPSSQSADWRLRDSPDERSVILKVLIGRDGKPQQCEPVLGPIAYAPAAIEAVSRWEFVPATQGKDAAEEWATFTLEWIGEERPSGR